MKVRLAQAADRDEWLRMRRALWPDGPAEAHLAEMQEQLERPSQLAAFVIEAEEPGRLCGFLEASLRAYADGCDTRPVGYIEGWYVDPAYQRQGLGRELVVAAEDWARAQGCREMASDCEEDNTVSLRAHLALGYHETERLIHFCKRL